MSAGTFEIISITGFLLAILFATVSVILFFRLNVLRLIGILTGKTEKIGIEKITEENLKQAKKNHSVTMRFAGTERTTPLKEEVSEGTTLLGTISDMQNATTLLDNSETTMLNGGNNAFLITKEEYFVSSDTVLEI